MQQKIHLEITKLFKQVKQYDSNDASQENYHNKSRKVFELEILKRQGSKTVTRQLKQSLREMYSSTMLP